MIISLENKKVKEWTKLHNKKYREEEFLLFDEKSIKLAYKKKLLKTLIYVNECPFECESSYEVSKDVMNKISKRENIKYIGVCKKLPNTTNYKNRVLLLDNVQDPLNLGRIIELCNAFNYDCLLLSENTCDLYHPNCLDAAKDSLFKVSICKTNLVTEIQNLKSKGFKIYSTGLSNKTVDINTIKPHDKMAFVLGNEGSGISEEVFNISDKIVKINMDNLDSLNVAMAGSIVLYKFNNL